LIGCLLAFSACADNRPSSSKTLPAAIIQASAGQTPSEVHEDAGHGIVELAVSFPKRDYPGFRAQVIPLSTNALGVTATRGGVVISRSVLSRPAMGGLATASIQLPSAVGYSFDVGAFREAQPDLATAVPIARGTATGINVSNSQVSQANITLAPLFAPTITSLSALGGLVGDTVTISGANLGAVNGVLPVVVLGAATASVFSSVSPTSVQVVVPPGATVGTVVVTSDGIPSTSAATFWVATALSLSASRSVWDPSPGDNRIAIFGSKLAFSANPVWSFRPGESASTWGAPPAATFSSSNTTAATIGSTTGLLTAGNAFQSTNITASLFSLTAGPIRVTAQDVISFAVTPASAIVGPGGDPSVSFRAINTLSDGSTVDAATWAVSDPASLSIGANGSVTAANSATFGKSVVTATSALKALTATANCTLANFRVDTIAGSSNGLFDGPGNVAQFNYPYNLALVGTTLFLAEGYSDLRTVDLSSSAFTVGTVSGSYGRTSYALAAAGGQVYATDAGGKLQRYDRSNGTWTTIANLAATIRGLAVESDGTIYAASLSGKKILAITPGGAVSTLAGSGNGAHQDGAGSAASFTGPYGLVLDGFGNLFVADSSDSLSGRIRKVEIATGKVMTLAGNSTSQNSSLDGTATTATLDRPTALGRGPDGFLVVAEFNRIRRVNPSSGFVQTVAGPGRGAGATDDGIGSAASFGSLYVGSGVAVDSAGTIFVAAQPLVRRLVTIP
jgi:hypothetical protein